MVRPCQLGAWADPGIFVREGGGGGGGPGQSDKKSSNNVFFFFLFFFFFSPQLILQKSNGQFQRNLSFFKVPEGVQHFPGGSNCLFPIETHITCDFPGGVRTPYPPSGSALGVQRISVGDRSPLVGKVLDFRS